MTLTAGLGFKLDHLEDALAARADGLWFEVHAENYMVDGGPRLAALTRLRHDHPVSLHGVGLSIASIDPPEPDHLAMLRRLIDRIDPVAVSDHLAWQRWDGAHVTDFLPFPRTAEALDIVCGNVGRIQDALGRRMLIENPSLYVDLPGHEMDEAEFMNALARRSGCGLLLDVNNIYVSAANLNTCAEARMDAVPGDLVGEIHLAGHSPDANSALLIDSHDTPVCREVWDLFIRLIDRIGPRPALIERDGDVPAFPILMAERWLAHEAIARTRETILV